MKKSVSRIFGAAIICVLALMLNVTAFAVGSTSGFTVKYDNNGTYGTAPLDGKTYLSGEFAIVADEGELSKGDNVFVGWSKTPEAVSADYIPGDKIEIQGDVTLYSVWADKNTTSQTATISNSGKIRLTPVNTGSSFPDRSFVSGN